MEGREVYELDQDDDLGSTFVGRRIVGVEMNVELPAGSSLRWATLEPYGKLTLDDGTEIYAAGHDGGCACSAGCYQLTKLATVDNIITAVKVVDESGGDDMDDYEGRWSIAVVAEAEELTVAEFEGSDGNGYYGTGFLLEVVKPAAA